MEVGKANMPLGGHNPHHKWCGYKSNHIKIWSVIIATNISNL